jgi:hypothetical protein
MEPRKRLVSWAHRLQSMSVLTCPQPALLSSGGADVWGSCAKRLVKADQAVISMYWTWLDGGGMKNVSSSRSDLR